MRKPTSGTPLSVALFSACNWLKARPELTADPDILLEFVSAWVLVAKPSTPELARQAGIHAAKECAGCQKHELTDLINPEDLTD